MWAEVTPYSHLLVSCETIGKTEFHLLERRRPAPPRAEQTRHAHTWARRAFLALETPPAANVRAASGLRPQEAADAAVAAAPSASPPRLWRRLTG
jgi:hypothetical protein